MKLIPITEKAHLSKAGKYTFSVDLTAGKIAIKGSFGCFWVHAVDVRTIRTYVEHKRNARGTK